MLQSFMAVWKAVASVSWFLPLGAGDGSSDGHLFFMAQSWINVNQITNNSTTQEK